MRGELIAVWSETPVYIWSLLEQIDEAPTDLYCELYRAAADSFRVRITIEQLADVIDDPVHSREAFLRIPSDQFKSEWQLVQFFERAYDALDELAGAALTEPFFHLLKGFIAKFGIRYDLRRPFILCPNVAGIFTGLLNTLQEITMADAHLKTLMNGFEESVCDLRYGISEERIKTCIAKQMMLIEGFGAKVPGVTGATLGKMCSEMKSWPHPTVKEALSKLYGFASDYPGIRHGGNSQGVLRPVEMRDMIAMSILLAGFTPYFGDQIDSTSIYHGS